MFVAKFTAAALEDVGRLPKNVRNALEREFSKRMLRDPITCSEALGEPLAGFRSYHFGKYRVVFRVYEHLNAIAVVGLGKKSSKPNVYDKLEKLAATGKLAEKFLAAVKLIAGPD